MADTARRDIAIWLFVCAAAVYAMVVIGGVTRLTGSGLSMVEWRPLIGWLPPLTETDWQRVFELYQRSPQYAQTNAGMELAAFKSIFWWEYVHRLWGRAIGLVFALPFAWFLVRRRLNAALTGRLVLFLLLGGLQGGLGWYMVKSGLVDRPAVSQYRLTAHLALALLLYAAMFWTALQLAWPRPRATARHPRALAGSLLALTAVTILAGGFMAGTDAGLTFNSYPLMDGRFLPRGYLRAEPWFMNPFENVTAINFNHRWLGSATALLTVFVWLRCRTASGSVRRLADGLLAVVAIQFALGLVTLLGGVPLALAATHQAGAVALLSLNLALVYRLGGD